MISGASIVRKAMDGIKRNVLLFGLLVFAFGLRIWGTKIGLPTADLVGDETFSVSYLLRIFASGNPFTQTVNPYPVMLSVLHAPFVVSHLAILWIANGFHSAGELQTYLLVHGVNALLFWPRFVSVCAGTATIYLLYRILELAFSRRPAFFGALAATVNVLAVSISHWGRAHAVLSFYIAGAAYAALLCQTRNEKKYFYWSVAAAACACSTHYLGVSSLIFPFIALLSIKPFWRSAGKAAALFIAIVVPAYVINLTGIINMIRGTYQNYYLPNQFAGLYPIGRFERFYYIVADLFALDPVGVVVGGIGILLLLIRRRFTRPVVTLLVGLGFLYAVQVAMVAARHETRWLLPFDLFLLGVGVASVADALVRDAARFVRWKIAFLVLLLLPGCVITIKWLSLLGTHTQVQVEQWMIAHRTEPMFLYTESLNPTPTPEAASWNAAHSPRLQLSAKNAYVIAHPQDFSEIGISYYHATDLPDGDHCPILRDLGIRYVILSYTVPEERERQKSHIISCISEPSLVRYTPGPDALQRRPFENLVNSIVSAKYIFSSSAIGPWYEILSVSEPISHRP